MVNRQEIMGCESVDMVRFDLGTLLQGQMRIAKIESAYNSLIIGDRASHIFKQTTVNAIVFKLQLIYSIVRT